MKTDRKKWRVTYTKPRSEKKIAERLEKQGLEVYCPLQIILKSNVSFCIIMKELS